MSRRTKQWRKIARQAGLNHRDSSVSHLIPSERLVSEESKRIITEPASPEKRALMISAMQTQRKSSR